VKKGIISSKQKQTIGIFLLISQFYKHKMEQRVIITDSQYDVQSLIDKGWKVTSVTAQYVTTAHSYTERGKFCFILEKKS
jgi:hypothetical protein